MARVRQQVPPLAECVLPHGRPRTSASSRCGVFGRAAVAEQLLDTLVVKERVRQQREQTPNLLAIDSQTVKIMQFISEETGVDANKKINAGPPVRS